MIDSIDIATNYLEYLISLVKKITTRRYEIFNLIAKKPQLNLVKCACKRQILKARIDDTIGTVTPAGNRPYNRIISLVVPIRCLTSSRVTSNLFHECFYLPVVRALGIQITSRGTVRGTQRDNPYYAVAIYANFAPVVLH